MFCSNCGKENDNNDSFCVVCGNQLIQHPNVNSDSPLQQPVQQYNQYPNQPYQQYPYQNIVYVQQPIIVKKSINIPAIISFIATVIGLLLIFYVMSNSYHYYNYNPRIPNYFDKGNYLSNAPIYFGVGLLSIITSITLSIIGLFIKPRAVALLSLIFSVLSALLTAYLYYFEHIILYSAWRFVP